MATVYELAERHGLTPKQVTRWLRAKGLMSGKGTQVTAAAEAAFRKAHGGAVPFSVAFAGEAASAAPASPAPEPPPPTRPRREATLVDHQRGDRFYKKQFDETHAAYLAAKAALAEITAERDALQAKLASAKARPARPEVPARPAEPTLAAALSALGLTGEKANEAVLALLADEARAAALLAGLRLTDEAALAPIQFVCSDGLCERLAASQGLVAVRAPSSGCRLCGGRATQRWVRWMGHQLVGAGRPRLMVVGGSEPTHTELKGLMGLVPGVDLKLVDGTAKATRQQARSRCRGADVVVIWGSTRLNHSVSDLYKAEALSTPHVLVVPVGGGARGVQALAKAVVDALAEAGAP